MSDEEVAACIRKSLLEHQQLLAHCNGDAAAEQYLTQFEKIVRELDAKDTLRPVMIHAQLVQKEQLETDEAAANDSFLLCGTCMALGRCAY